jgi:hypothetical protein
MQNGPSAGPFLYPPVLKPYRALEQKSCNEEEVGQDACARRRGNHARYYEKRPQDRNATIERLADMHEHGFHIDGGMTLRESQFHLLAFLCLTITSF